MTLTNPCHRNYKLWKQINKTTSTQKTNAKHVRLSIIATEFLLGMKLIRVKKPF